MKDTRGLQAGLGRGPRTCARGRKRGRGEASKVLSRVGRRTVLRHTSTPLSRSMCTSIFGPWYSPGPSCPPNVTKSHPVMRPLWASIGNWLCRAALAVSRGSSDHVFREKSNVHVSVRDSLLRSSQPPETKSWFPRVAYAAFRLPGSGLEGGWAGGLVTSLVGRQSPVAHPDSHLPAGPPPSSAERLVVVSHRSARASHT